jgi:hypothetical protein
MKQMTVRPSAGSVEHVPVQSRSSKMCLCVTSDTSTDLEREFERARRSSFLNAQKAGRTTWIALQSWCTYLFPIVS